MNDARRSAAAANREKPMRVAIFSVKAYERPFLDKANVGHGHELVYFEPALQRNTAALADGFEVVCCFVHDALDAGVLLQLHRQGTRLVALRCAGFNQVDLHAADQLGLTTARVPAYSPSAVAEHAIAMIMTLNRKLHRAHARVREGNFALDGLLGFELSGSTAGIVGTGAIGRAVARILRGFGTRLLAYDLHEHAEMHALGATYVPLDKLLEEAHIVSLHVPLTPDTRHLICSETLARMRRGAMLINTSRGDLIDTRAAIEALKSGRLGYLGLDVYEEEADLFYKDLSQTVIQDDVFARLLTVPNVLVTSHQGFFTGEALEAIAKTTLENISAFAAGDLPTERVVTAAATA